MALNVNVAVRLDVLIVVLSSRVLGTAWFGVAPGSGVAPGCVVVGVAVAVAGGVGVAVGVGSGLVTNVAVTVRELVRLVVHVPVPEQPPPDQPVNTDPVAGVAVSVTSVPES